MRGRAGQGVVVKLLEYAPVADDRQVALQVLATSGFPSSVSAAAAVFERARRGGKLHVVGSGCRGTNRVRVELVTAEVAADRLCTVCVPAPGFLFWGQRQSLRWSALASAVVVAGDVDAPSTVLSSAVAVLRQAADVFASGRVQLLGGECFDDAAEFCARRAAAVDGRLRARFDALDAGLVQGRLAELVLTPDLLIGALTRSGVAAGLSEHAARFEFAEPTAAMMLPHCRDMLASTPPAGWLEGVGASAVLPGRLRGVLMSSLPYGDGSAMSVKRAEMLVGLATQVFESPAALVRAWEEKMFVSMVAAAAPEVVESLQKLVSALGFVPDAPSQVLEGSEVVVMPSSPLEVRDRRVLSTLSQLFMSASSATTSAFVVPSAVLASPPVDRSARALFRVAVPAGVLPTSEKLLSLCEMYQASPQRFESDATDGLVELALTL